MDSDIIIYFVWGSIPRRNPRMVCLAHWRRRLRAKRLQLTDLFKGYFRGDMPADQLGQRARKITSRHFTGTSEFYSLAIAAFQSAVDAKVAHLHSEKDERKLF